MPWGASLVHLPAGLISHEIEVLDANFNPVYSATINGKETPFVQQALTSVMELRYHYSIDIPPPAPFADSDTGAFTWSLHNQPLGEKTGFAVHSVVARRLSSSGLARITLDSFRKFHEQFIQPMFPAYNILIAELDQMVYALLLGFKHTEPSKSQDYAKLALRRYQTGYFAEFTEICGVANPLSDDGPTFTYPEDSQLCFGRKFNGLQQVDHRNLFLIENQAQTVVERIPPEKYSVTVQDLVNDDQASFLPEFKHMPFIQLNVPVCLRRDFHVDEAYGGYFTFDAACGDEPDHPGDVQLCRYCSCLVKSDKEINKAITAFSRVSKKMKKLAKRKNKLPKNKRRFYDMDFEKNFALKRGTAEFFTCYEPDAVDTAAQGIVELSMKTSSDRKSVV